MTPTRRTFLAAAAAVPLAGRWATAAEPTAYWVYFGTYTGGQSGSKGVYRSKFDPATGALGAAEVAAEVGSPSFVCPSPNNTVLYAVGETPGGGGKGGGVYAYSIDPRTGDLSKIGETHSGGAGRPG
jgi:6-phosphogluconolactonase